MKLKRPKKERTFTARTRELRPQEWPECFANGCTKVGKNSHTCLTCERLAATTQPDREVKVIHYCPDHRELGVTQIRKHALLKHPANVLRVVAAGLAGEDIT